MSWPKAWVKFPDKPKPRAFQRVSLWGFTARGHWIEDGKAVHGPCIAVEAYFPDGRLEDFNWEATEWLHRIHGITNDWFRQQGIKLVTDGYGADQKHAELDKS